MMDERAIDKIEGIKAGPTQITKTVTIHIDYLVWSTIDNVFDSMDHPLTFHLLDMPPDFYIHLKSYSPELEDEIDTLSRVFDAARSDGIDIIIVDSLTD